jgi:hypothetical protein
LICQKIVVVLPHEPFAILRRTLQDIAPRADLVIARGSGVFESYICPARPVTPPHLHSAFRLLDLPRETY